MANIDQMIADLDQQIASLQTARNALALAHGLGPVVQTGPRTLTTFKKSLATGYKAQAGVKRTMSPDARRRIAEAQKKRWAAVNKAKGGASKKVAAKKVVAKKVAPHRPKAKKVAAPVVPAPVQESTPEEVVS